MQGEGRAAIMRFITCCMLAAHAAALDNSLGLRPPMAWSSWNRFGLQANEQDIIETARALLSTGLADLGYKYVNIDAGYLAARDSTGKLIVTKSRYPSGIKHLGDTLHAMGLKLGVYTDISGHTCGDGPGTGSKGHYDLDAATFAEWGADYLKVDFCGPNTTATRDDRDISVDPVVQYEAWASLRDALNRTGRPIYYSICPHTKSDGVGTERPWSLPYAPPPSWTRAQRHALANSILVEYANTADQWIGGSEGGIVENIDAMLHATKLEYSAAGSWNDADMLQTCNYGKGNTPGSGMTLNEYRAHYAVWSILASPLILGNDIRSISQDHPDCLALLLNDDIVAVNQDSAALPARLVSQTPPMAPKLTSADITSQVLARPLSQNRLAVVLLNRGPSAARLDVGWSDLGLDVTRNMLVYDVIHRKSAGTATGKLIRLVPSHDVAFVILSPKELSVAVI
eukprot:TRINITY_DN27423_c0_g2_i1.p1 TRINITY_DN27423_c0_g2~~TRINITY_DN27423_c0_g2_i1.p1  ORF type:complete len:456 (-),score=61.16 TRINITY_DN27423_c0_g2_i1:65-1432(-)